MPIVRGSFVGLTWAKHPTSPPLSSLWWLTDWNIFFCYIYIFFLWSLAPQPVGSKPVRLCCSMCVCVIAVMAKAEDCCSEWQAGALAFRSRQRFDISALQADGSRDRPVFPCLSTPSSLQLQGPLRTSHSCVASVFPTAAVWAYYLCFNCGNIKHMQSCFHYTTSRWHVVTWLISTRKRYERPEDTSKIKILRNALYTGGSTYGLWMETVKVCADCRSFLMCTS